MVSTFLPEGRSGDRNHRESGWGGLGFTFKGKLSSWLICCCLQANQTEVWPRPDMREDKQDLCRISSLLRTSCVPRQLINTFL